MKLGDILAGGLGGLIRDVASVVDKFHLSKEEKAAIQIALEDAASRQFEIIERSVQARYEAVTKVIEAEMNQGDTFTKRARPMVVYVGLLLYILEAIAPGVFGITMHVPEDFTFAWAGVVGVWMIGRSYEKVNGLGTRARWITGAQDPNRPGL